jgi:hypothetical protein
VISAAARPRDDPANILNDRPEDYEEPHHAPMSQG